MYDSNVYARCFQQSYLYILMKPSYIDHLCLLLHIQCMPTYMRNLWYERLCSGSLIR
jgi:hypothetical protein